MSFSKPAGAGSKRLFFALWPDQQTRRRCVDLTDGLKVNARPVVASNLHVTLVFLGNVDQATEKALCSAAAEVTVQPIQLSFDRLSYWRKPAVGCLTASQNNPAVEALAAALADIAGRLGLVLDERPYRPHVTLYRKLHQPLTAEVDAIEWRADGFCLVESRSTPHGVEYKVLQRWPHP